MPDHSQGEGRQPQRFGAGAQIEPFAKILYNRFLDTRHQITRRYGLQYREAMRKRQFQASAEPSCGEFIIDQSPWLIAINYCCMVQLRKSFERELAGMGFYVLRDGGYGHGGGTPGINGELHILPQDGYVLVALANRDPRMASDMVDFITPILPAPRT